MIQGIRRLASIDAEHNLLHETLARNGMGLIPIVATDSSTITRDTLPANYVQYYSNGSTNRLYININNSIISVNLAEGTTANQALSNLVSVAINTSLVPDTDSTDNLGSSSKFWSKTYTDNVVFPATVVASADPNTQDDYEEGLHEVTVTCSSSGGYNVDESILAYTKIGRVVHIQGRIAVTSESGSPSGQIRVSLPFAIPNLSENAENFQGAAELVNHGGTLPNGVTVRGEANASFFVFRNTADDGTQLTLTEANVDTVWQFNVGFSYVTT